MIVSPRQMKQEGCIRRISARRSGFRPNSNMKPKVDRHWQHVSTCRQRSIRSGKDVLSLLNWVIFNYLIGNSDAHGKNISLLLLPEGPMLAPFYDLISTRIYAHYGLAEGLAMKIGGEGDPRVIQKKH